MCELLMVPKFTVSGGEPSPQSSVTDVRSLSWSVQLPLAETVSGAFPEVGATESVQSGEAAWAIADKHTHIRMLTIQLRRFTTRHDSVRSRPLAIAPRSGPAWNVLTSPILRCGFGEQGC